MSNNSESAFCGAVKLGSDYCNITAEGSLALNTDPQWDLDVLEEDDEYIFYPVELIQPGRPTLQALTMYKRVDKKIRPVSTTFSPNYEVWRTIPEDPLKTLPALSKNPPKFQATERLSHERLAQLEINKDGFLSPQEEALFEQIMLLNQDAIAFADSEQGTFKEEYFHHIKLQQCHIPRGI
jgi:hypothetical protein